MDKKNLLEKIDELNLITVMNYYKTKKQERVQKMEDDFLSMLIEAYLLGFGENDDVDLVKLNQTIYKEIDGKTVFDRVKTHVENEDVEALLVVLTTEWHRNYNQGAYDGAVTHNNSIQIQPSKGGKPYTMKKWVTMRDERVRDTHEYLEGVTIPINEEFYTKDGDHALFPSDFENPSNNINCRCILEYI